MRLMGFSAAQAFEVVRRGGTIYAVSIEPDKRSLYSDYRLCEGAWRDTDDTVYREPSILVSDMEEAVHIGVYNRQLYILAIGKVRSEEGYLYLLPDTERNRLLALSVAGGYTADGRNLIAFTFTPISPSLLEYRYRVIRCRGGLFPVVDL